jgi:putative membrane protein
MVNSVNPKSYGMKDEVLKFLTAQERLAIERKVKEAEASTSGEIVIVAVAASSVYPSAVLASSGAIATVLAIAGTLLLRSENMWLFLALFAVFFMAANEVVKRAPLLKRPFVTRREIAEEVEEAAIRSFYHRKVHETRDRTGILIYISIFEHSVRVLADKGISAKVGTGAWQEIVDLITKGISEGRPGTAICSAVGRCGDLLKRHLPSRPDDRNELPDAMILGSSGDASS